MEHAIVAFGCLGVAVIALAIAIVIDKDFRGR